MAAAREQGRGRRLSGAPAAAIRRHTSPTERNRPCATLPRSCSPPRPPLPPAPRSRDSRAAARPRRRRRAEPQIGSFGFDTAGMDRSVEPGDNFYHYANGTWAQDDPDPRRPHQLRHVHRARRPLEPRTRDDPRGSGAQAAARKIGDFYASFMDAAAVEAAGHRAAAAVASRDRRRQRPRRARAGDGPTCSGRASTAPFGGFVDSRRQESRHPHLSVLPGRARHARPRLLSQRGRRRWSQAQRLSGLSRPAADPGRRAERPTPAPPPCSALETSIAAGPLDPGREPRRRARPTINGRRADFARQGAGLRLERLFRGDWASRPSAASWSASRAPSPAWPPRSPRAPLAVLKDYLMLRRDRRCGALSVAALRRRQFRLPRHRRSTARRRIRSRWKRGVDLVTGAMADEVGKVYVERYFPPEDQGARRTQLVRTSSPRWTGASRA